MNCKRWDASLLGVVAMGLALACESRGPIAAPATSRTGEFSAGGARDPAGQYDDGSAGTLTISCRISNAEPGRFEGVTASKGFLDFLKRVTSPTLFHVLN